MNPDRYLRHFILIPLGVVLGLLFLMAVYGLDRMNRHHVTQTIRNTQHSIQARFQRRLEKEAGHLSALIEVLAHDPRLIDGLARKDRTDLLAASADFYPALQKQHGITHFYFTGPDRVNLLRAHMPERHGDTINRYTTLQAERTGKQSWGIELGPLGLFTLRVVRPVFAGQKLLGYLELGEEIDHVIDNMAVTSKVDIHVLINKRFLNRRQWEDGNRLMGRTPDWDRFSDVVLSSSTGLEDAELIAGHLHGHRHPDHGLDTGLLSWEQTRHPLYLPLRDASGTEVGEMALHIDTSDMAGVSRHVLLLFTGLGVPLALMLFALFYLLLQRVQQRLISAQQEREAMTAQHLWELGRREAVLEASETRLKEAQRLAELGDWELDLTDNELTWSDEVYRIFERDPESQKATLDAFWTAIHPDDRGTVERTFQTAVAQHSTYDIEHRLLMPDGRIKHVRERGETRYDEQGNPLRSIGTVQDITHAKLSEEQLSFLAHYDPLTRLPNRALLQSRLTHALEHARRHKTQLALLFLDMDHFKLINDSMGHPTGDELLLDISARIGARIREEDTLARVGGDEFIILMEQLGRPEDAATLAHELVNLLKDPFELEDGHTVYIGVSIGISLFPEDGDTATSLLKNADAAMYLAKKSGRNTYRFYTEALTMAANERLDMEAGLRRALDDGEFILHYQPQAACMNGAILGVEALVRWQPPGQAMISPLRFIPLAEETGLIVPLGDWVLRTACAQAKAWLDAGMPPLTMAVNLSPRQFRQPDLVERIKLILEETGLPPRQLELEITEGAVMEDSEQAMGVLHELKALGLSIAIDDFGTGYSSLAYLKRFAIDKLKVDQSFVRDIPADEDSMAITASIIAMAKNLHLKVLAEGVETEEQLAFLQIHGCEACQGYLFNRPLSAVDLEEWLAGRAGDLD